MENSSNIESLLPVNLNENEEVVISSRDLHSFLEIQTRFNVWITRMLEYGFVENEDYQRVTQKCDTPGGVQEMVDYILKIDMAKEICMIQRSDRGRQARKYFIEMEKKFNSPEALISRLLELKNNMKKSEDSTDAYQNTENYQVKKSATYTSLQNPSNIDTSFRDSAKILGIRENLLINWLLINNYCYRDVKGNIKPYSKYMDYFTLREFTTASGYTGVQTLINSKGRETFKNLLIDEKIIKNDDVKLLN